MEVSLMAKAKVVRNKSTSTVTMSCFFCGSAVSADSDTRAILCSRCTARLAGTPTEINKFPKREVSMTDVMVSKLTKAPKVVKVKEDGGPQGRGWHLKKHYVAPNGKVYSFGKLVSEAKVVAE
jgi:hypothetical protein